MGPKSKVLRLFPGPAEELAAEDVYSDLLQPRSDGVQEEKAHVAINMVSTLDGKVSVGGKASPIGSGVDRIIMRNIRCAFDAVLVGAGTVRAEEMNLSVPAALAEKRKAEGLPEQPLGVILAGSRDLPLERKLFRPQEGQRIVAIAGHATPGSTIDKASALGVRVLRTGEPGLPEPEEILRLLRELTNVRTVLLEGGPTVNGAFLSAAKVDELFLTLSPKISLSGTDAPCIASAALLAEPATTNLDLASIHACTQQSEIYLRYQRRASPASKPR